MKIHAILKLNQAVQPTKLLVMGQAKAEFPIAGVVSFGKIKNHYCTIDIEQPDHICMHIETIGDESMVVALLHEKMFKSIHQFFTLMMNGEQVSISYIAGMYIEFGHFMLNVPQSALVLPNSLEAFLDIVMHFNYDMLEDEMEQLRYDTKGLRIGNDPKNAVVLPIFDGAFNEKRRMGWTYTASTYDTKTHTIKPHVYQIVMEALDKLEKMDSKQNIYCVESLRNPWHNEHMMERCDVSEVVIHYTRNGLPKEIILQGVYG